MEIAAYSTVAMTLGLVVARPRLGKHFRLTPAMAALGGVLVMLSLGIVRLAHLERAASELWSPFVAIGAIMTMTHVAERVRLLELWAKRVEARGRSCAHLFGLVFGLGVLTSAALNNDAAILLLTPLVVALIRQRYPTRPTLVIPFAFAVFMSAGVAALPVSNPMNMVVAEMSDIDFNTYAKHMLPVAVACWLLGYWVLKRIFASDLCGPEPSDITKQNDTRPTAVQARMMALLVVVLCSYPIVGYLGGPVWAVASAGAVAALGLLYRHSGDNAIRTIVDGVSWQTLAFLACVLIMSLGLFEVGLVDHLTILYADGDLATVGTTSAVGSAVLNNHPMSHLNMMALDSAGSSDVAVLAALVGGDLGPRLLPMGSLAGLLWLELLRRDGVDIKLGLFVKVGIIVTIPTLAVSLAILSLY